MSWNKPTAGPWLIKKELGDTIIVGPSGLQIAEVERYVWPGRDTTKKAVHMPEQANAKLIAAAPALLKAAKLTELHFQRVRNSGEFQGDDEHEAWTALRNAIALAEKGKP